MLPNPPNPPMPPSPPNPNPPKFPNGFYPIPEFKFGSCYCG